MSPRSGPCPTAATAACARGSPAGRRIAPSGCRRLRPLVPVRPASGPGTVRLPPAPRRHPGRAETPRDRARRHARPMPHRSTSPASGLSGIPATQPGRRRREPLSSPRPAPPKARNAGEALRSIPSARHFLRACVPDPEHPFRGPQSARHSLPVAPPTRRCTSGAGRTRTTRAALHFRGASRSGDRVAAGLPASRERAVSRLRRTKPGFTLPWRQAGPERAADHGAL